MIIVYSKPNCPQCDVAKNILKQSLADYTEVSLGTDMTREEFISQFPTVRMMPHITYNGRTIDLSELKRIASLVGVRDERSPE